MSATDHIVKPGADVVIEALDRARGLIEAGWCKRKGYDRIGGQDCWCATGALAAISHTVRVSEHEVIPGKLIFDAAHTALRAELPQGYPSVALYNDAKTTTHDHVVNLFYRAVKSVRRADEPTGVTA